MNDRSTNHLEAKNLLLHIKGCGADVSLQVSADISAAELSARLEKHLRISMENNVFNIGGNRITGYEGRLLLNNRGFESNAAVSLIIESSPLSD